MFNLQVLTIYITKFYISNFLSDTRTCKEGEYICFTGYPPCIDTSMICDGITHCSDRDDEETCGE